MLGVLQVPVLRGTAKVTRILMPMGLVVGKSLAYPGIEIQCHHPSHGVPPDSMLSIFKPGTWFHFEGSLSCVDLGSNSQRFSIIANCAIVSTNRLTGVRATVVNVSRDHAILKFLSGNTLAVTAVFLTESAFAIGSDRANPYLAKLKGSGDLAKIIISGDQLFVDIIDGLLVQGCGWLATRASIVDMTCDDPHHIVPISKHFVGIVAELTSSVVQGEAFVVGSLFCNAPLLRQSNVAQIIFHAAPNVSTQVAAAPIKGNRFRIYVRKERQVRIGDRYDLEFVVNHVLDMCLASATFNAQLYLSVPHGHSTTDVSNGCANSSEDKSLIVAGIAQVVAMTKSLIAIGHSRKFPDASVGCMPNELHMSLTQFNSSFKLGAWFHFEGVLQYPTTSSNSVAQQPIIIASRVAICGKRFEGICAKVINILNDVTAVLQSNNVSILIHGSALETHIPDSGYIALGTKGLLPGDEVLVDVIDGIAVDDPTLWTATVARYSSDVGIQHNESHPYTDTSAQTQLIGTIISVFTDDNSSTEGIAEILVQNGTLHCDTKLLSFSMIPITTDKHFQPDRYHVDGDRPIKPKDRFEVSLKFDATSNKWVPATIFSNNTLRFKVPQSLVKTILPPSTHSSRTSSTSGNEPRKPTSAGPSTAKKKSAKLTITMPPCSSNSSPESNTMSQSANNPQSDTATMTNTGPQAKFSPLLICNKTNSNETVGATPCLAATNTTTSTAQQQNAIPQAEFSPSLVCSNRKHSSDTVAATSCLAVTTTTALQQSQVPPNSSSQVTDLTATQSVNEPKIKKSAATLNNVDEYTQTQQLPFTNADTDAQTTDDIDPYQVLRKAESTSEMLRLIKEDDDLWRLVCSKHPSVLRKMMKL